MQITDLYFVSQKSVRIGRNKLHIVTVFEELVSKSRSVFAKRGTCDLLAKTRLKSHHCIELYLRNG